MKTKHVQKIDNQLTCRVTIALHMEKKRENNLQNGYLCQVDTVTISGLVGNEDNLT